MFDTFIICHMFDGTSLNSPPSLASITSLKSYLFLKIERWIFRTTTVMVITAWHCILFWKSDKTAAELHPIPVKPEAHVRMSYNGCWPHWSSTTDTQGKQVQYLLYTKEGHFNKNFLPFCRKLFLTVLVSLGDKLQHIGCTQSWLHTWKPRVHIWKSRMSATTITTRVTLLYFPGNVPRSSSRNFLGKITIAAKFSSCRISCETGD